MSFNAPGDGPTIGGAGGGDWIGAVIGAGAGLYDSYQNRKVARENTDKNIAAAKREAELAYQRQVEMWNAQNLYNSPQSQMQRFQEAGLNSHLIYGQGNAGNTATSSPQYQPADIQYRYQSAPISPAISSILPTLMSVGTWMQNMRLSEAELAKRKTDTQRVEQLIEFLTRQNPELLRQSGAKSNILETQMQTQSTMAEQARAKLMEMSTEYRLKYGDDLWKQSGVPGPAGKIEGLSKLKFMQEFSKEKLLEAKASWSDFDITDPQAIMMMVMQSVMGMAGAQLRMRGNSAKPSQSQKARPRGVRRIKPSLRVAPRKYWD